MVNHFKVVNTTEHAVAECSPATTGVTARYFCNLWPQTVVEAPKRCERNFFRFSGNLDLFLGAAWRRVTWGPRLLLDLSYLAARELQPKAEGVLS